MILKQNINSNKTKTRACTLQLQDILQNTDTQTSRSNTLAHLQKQIKNDRNKLKQTLYSKQL